MAIGGKSGDAEVIRPHISKPFAPDKAMSKQDAVSRHLAIVDRALREFFPEDFYKRCMYAAFGISSLLNDEGISAHAVGGDFLCAVVSEDGSQLSLQGFGASTPSEPSHFWVRSGGVTIDLGPMYLAHESSYPAPPPPILRWYGPTPLPSFMAYREQIEYAADVQVVNPGIRQRMSEFVALCRAHNRSERGRIAPPSWQLRDHESLDYAARKCDPWAMAAVEFLRRSLKAEFPPL